MQNVFTLLSTLIIGSFIIQQLGVKSGKHIRSRVDDPTIPPVSSTAF